MMWNNCNTFAMMWYNCNKHVVSYNAFDIRLCLAFAPEIQMDIYYYLLVLDIYTRPLFLGIGMDNWEVLEVLD